MLDSEFEPSKQNLPAWSNLASILNELCSTPKGRRDGSVIFMEEGDAFPCNIAYFRKGEVECEEPVILLQGGLDTFRVGVFEE